MERIIKANEDISAAVSNQNGIDGHHPSSKSTDIRSELVKIISDDTIFVVPTTGIKNEAADAELQAGLAVLEEMDESFFNKKPKTEPFDIKPKIELKKELDNNDSSRDIKNELVEIISDDAIFVVPTTGIEKETTDKELQDQVEENMDSNNSGAEVRKRKKSSERETPKTFPCKQGLKHNGDRMHLNVKFLKKVPCAECGKSFESKQQLKNHMSAHHINCVLHFVS